MSKKPVKLTVINSNLPTYLKIVTNGNKKLTGRVQIEDGNTPNWITESGTIMYLNEDDGVVSYQLEVSPSQNELPISYSIFPTFEGTGGFLPFGFTLNPTTGLISGNTTENLMNDNDKITFYDDERPSWNTNSGSLGIINEKQTFNTTLNAEFKVGANSLHYYIVKGGLPFGLELDANTGVVSGSSTEIISPVPMEEHIIQNPTPRPRWNTLSGMVGVFDEKSNTSITLQATSNNGTISYSVVSGTLPFGLSLNASNGVISGNTGELIYKTTAETEIDFPRLLPVPTWITGRDVLPVATENSSYTYSLELNYDTDTYGQLYHRIIRGHLPFGLELSRDGIISGTVNEIIHSVPDEEHILEVITPKPTWQTPTGIIAEYNEKESISYSLVATSNNYNYSNIDDVIVSTEQSLNYTVIDGALPFGVTVDVNTGIISGELLEIITKKLPTDTISFNISDNKPLWDVPSGLLIKTTEKTPINLNVVASSPINSEITYKIVDGKLPFGIELSNTTGDIIGTTTELLYPENEEILDTGAPIIETDSYLGDFQIGDSVNITLSTSVYSGRTIAGFAIDMSNSNNALPFGISLSQTGTISGTIVSDNTTGQYFFTIIVFDSVGLRSSKSMYFNII